MTGPTGGENVLTHGSKPIFAHTCSIDPEWMPERCPRWRFGRWCANTGRGCQFRREAAQAVQAGRQGAGAATSPEKAIPGMEVPQGREGASTGFEAGVTS